LIVKSEACIDKLIDSEIIAKDNFSFGILSSMLLSDMIRRIGVPKMLETHTVEQEESVVYERFSTNHFSSLKICYKLNFVLDDGEGLLMFGFKLPKARTPITTSKWHC